MTTPSPIGRGEQIENLAQRHRFSNQLTPSEPNAENLSLLERICFGIGGIAVAVACGWFVWKLCSMAGAVWG